MLLLFGGSPKQVTSVTRQINEEFLQPDYEAAERLYQEWLNRPYNKCSCVSFVKAKIGYGKSVGAARNFPINSQEAKYGNVVILNESKYGHVAIVKEVKENTIVISEANYHPCQVGTREIAKNYSKIKGFYEIP